MTLLTDLQNTMALAQQGQHKAALKSAKAGMRRHKNNPAFPNFAGVCLCAVGKERESIPFYQKALALDPTFHDARRNLGMALATIKQAQKAVTVLTKAVANDPKDDISWQYLAIAKLSLGDIEEARQDICTALELVPNNGQSSIILMKILEKMDRISAALSVGQEALKFSPDNGKLLSQTATLLSYQIMLDEALSTRRHIVALDPQNIEGLNALANQLSVLGNQPEARSILLKVLDLSPADPATILQLSMFQTQDQNVALKDAALNALNNSARKDPDRAKLLFALAHISRKAGDTAAAESYYEKANREVASQLPYKAKAQTELNHKIIARYPGPIQSSLAPSIEPKPIYVVGLPRSGTTLTETILGAHPNVAPLGERRLPETMAGTFLNDLPIGPKEIADFADLQRENLPPLPEGTCAYVDKMPENHRYIGFLKSAFGNARFINLCRDPRDVALSQWQGHFAKDSIPYSYDLKLMAHRFNLYAESMVHWHKIMPGEILDLPYEDLVSDIETSSKTMAAFCGLKWTASMTQPHQHAGQVRTMSVHQVRQPVHTRSVRKWVRHEKMLAPFIADLDPDLWPEIR